MANTICFSLRWEEWHYSARSILDTMVYYGNGLSQRRLRYNPLVVLYMYVQSYEGLNAHTKTSMRFVHTYLGLVPHRPTHQVWADPAVVDKSQCRHDAQTTQVIHNTHPTISAYWLT